MTEYTTKTIQHGPCTIVIHRPLLTDAERAKREKAAQNTLGRVMSEYLKRKGERSPEIKGGTP